MASYRVAVVGATGLVGRTILRVLEERSFPVSELIPLASPQSRGKTLAFQGEAVPVRSASLRWLARADIVFFSAGAAVSREFAPDAAKEAWLVVDNSSAFRLDPDVPLVVPEVNVHLLAQDRAAGRLIANPNCSTIQMVVALWPLHLNFGLESVVVATYQSVSGSGAQGLKTLETELQTGRRVAGSPYPHAIAFNVVPQIADFDEEGWSGEERKMMAETRKIMDLPSLHVVPTAVRVPVRMAHSQAVYATFSRPAAVPVSRRILSMAPGIALVDDPPEAIYPLALEAEGRDDVLVGRLRQNPDDPRGLVLWIVADNIRKGAAMNAVQIAEAAVAQREPKEARTQYA